jgi:alkanesulfonate monooxygenase SsuD/methylene tetrahydromethanopterin reductase-like flavin-dependent oxidoreductase (luciferase family)
MRVGVLLTGALQEIAVADAYQQWIEHVQVAEENGFDSAWIIESHFSARVPCPSPITLGAAIAAATRDILVGVSVKLPLEHPLKICEDAAVLDLLSGGRLLFGADPGVGEEEWNGSRFAWPERWEIFCEALDIIVKGWTQDSFAYLGKFYRLPVETRVADRDNPFQPEPCDPPHLMPMERAGLPFDYLSVLPKPVQIPHPPIYLGGGSQRSVEFTARNGNSLLLVRDGDAAQTAAAYWRALEQAGRHKHEVDLVIARDVYVEADGHKARSRVDHVADNALVGSPREVLDGIKALQRETGLRHFLCHMQLPGLSPDCVNDSLRLFASEVRPLLQM